MVPSRFFLQTSRASIAKIKQEKQLDRSSHVGWPAPRKGKVSGKTTTKIKVSFLEKKVQHFKESFTFQSKCCILKKVLH